MAEPRRIYRTIARAAQQRPPSNAAFSAAEDRGTDSLNAPSVAGAAAAAADSRYDRSEPARPEPPANAGKPASASVGDDARIVPQAASRNHRPSGKAAHQKAPLQGAAKSSAASGGYSETEQGPRSQNASVLQRAQHDAGTATRTLPAARAEGCIATSPDQYPNGETAAPSAADKPAQPDAVKAAQGAAPLRHRQKAATPPLAGEASGGAAKPKRGRKGKADDTPPTPAEIIKAKRRRCADAEDIAGFLTKLVAIVVLLGLLFGFAFGVTPMENDDMSPRISAGDLLLYYRLADDLVTGDVLVFEKDGEQYVGRIVANPGDTVEVTDQATLVVNGSTVLENDIYYTTPKYDNGPAYPVTLAQDEYFILCDYREGARDSRYFGPVSLAEIKGKVITVVRRSGL